MHRTFWGIADPEQLAALALLLEEYAKEMGISGDQQERDRLAECILVLFNKGFAPDEIRRRLDPVKPHPRNPE